MKKSIIFAFVLFCMFGLIGCKNSTSESASNGVLSSEIEVISSDKSAKLSEEEAKVIFEILENGEWTNDLSACASDCSLVVSGNTLTYHFECGTFNDSQNQKSLTTDEDTKKVINNILENYVTLVP